MSAVHFRTGFHSAEPRAFGAEPQKFDCAQNDPYGVRAVRVGIVSPHLKISKYYAGHPKNNVALLKNPLDRGKKRCYYN